MIVSRAPDFLSELPEARATGSTAQIYDEVKRLTGVPMVALIYRHLATLPGALEWTWSAVGPAMRSGRLQEEAWRIAREARAAPIASLPRPALEVLGIDENGLSDIHAVVDAYNRANPVNLLAVRCLARIGQETRGADTAGTDALPADAWTPPAPIGPLIPMVHPTAMPEAVAKLILLVVQQDAHADTVTVPSLYRHFVNRPAFLALLVTVLLSRFGDGSVSQSVRSIREAMDSAAVGFALEMRAGPAPHRGIAAALEQFATVIPEMITVGSLLKAALPAPQKQK